jgi:hypothetical protein
MKQPILEAHALKAAEDVQILLSWYSQESTRCSIPLLPHENCEIFPIPISSRGFSEMLPDFANGPKSSSTKSKKEQDEFNSESPPKKRSLTNTDNQRL